MPAAGRRRRVRADAGPRRGEAARAGDVELVHADLLEFLDKPATFDAIVSTYAIHHLEADEKAVLIERAAARLAPGGRLAVGDLMAASRSAVDGVKARLQHPDADALFAEEFPWFVDETLGPAGRCGLHGCRGEQFSDLSWGAGRDAAV